VPVPWLLFIKIFFLFQEKLCHFLYAGHKHCFWLHVATIPRSLPSSLPLFIPSQVVAAAGRYFWLLYHCVTHFLLSSRQHRFGPGWGLGTKQCPASSIPMPLLLCGFGSCFCSQLCWDSGSWSHAITAAEQSLCLLQGIAAPGFQCCLPCCLFLF
jgi:hypothetical protein